MNIWKKDDQQAWGTMGRASSTDVFWTLAVDVAFHGGDKFVTSWIQSSPHAGTAEYQVISVNARGDWFDELGRDHLLSGYFYFYNHGLLA